MRLDALAPRSLLTRTSDLAERSGLVDAEGRVSSAAPASPAERAAAEIGVHRPSRLVRDASRGRGPVALFALAVSLGVAALAPRALAQEDPCDEEDSLARRPVETTPSVGANDVTIDAPVAVRYSAGYFGPDGPGDDPATLLRLVRCPPDTLCTLGCAADDGTDVPGLVQVIGDQLFFLPDGGLEPNSVYVGRARGIDDALDLRFCTDDSVDSGPPVLGAFIDATPSDATAECVLPDGGRLVGLRWEQAVDDGPAGSIEYLLYLVRATNVEAPQLRDRVRNYPSREITLNLRLSPEEIGAPVCVRAVAVDGVGNMSEASELQCFDPLTDAAFQPLCAVSAPGSGRATPFGIASFALLITAFAMRRRHRMRRASVHPVTASPCRFLR